MILASAYFHRPPTSSAPSRVARSTIATGVPAGTSPVTCAAAVETAPNTSAGRKSLFRMGVIRRLADLDDVVRKRRVHLLEPVRRAVRHDDHVALGQEPPLTVVDRLAANLVCCGFLAVDHLATGDHC